LPKAISEYEFSLPKPKVMFISKVDTTFIWADQASKLIQLIQLLRNFQLGGGSTPTVTAFALQG